MFGLEKLRQLVEIRLARHGPLGAALIKGAAGTAGLKGVHAFIVFGSAIVLANLLGPAGYGVFAFVTALVQLLSTPSELGVPGLAVREIAVTNARRNWGEMRGFIRWAHGMIAIVSVIIAVGGAIILLTWGHNLDPVKRSCMWLGLILVPLVSLNALRGSMLRGLRKVLLGQLPEQIVRPLVFLALVLLIMLLGTRPTSPFVALSAHVVSVAIAFAVGLLLFLRNRPAQIADAMPVYKPRIWFASCIPFGLTAMMQLINGRTDILMLGVFRPDSDVGIYRVAAQIASVVVFGLQIVNPIQGPHIAHLFAKGELVRLQKMITRSSQAVFLIALAAVAVIVLFGKVIISTLFGPEFSGAYVPLVIICIGQLVNACIGSVGSLLNMTGHERDTTKSVVIGATINLALNVLLTPRWGILGAAVATSSTLIVWNLLMWHKVRVRIGIEPSPFFRTRH